MTVGKTLVEQERKISKKSINAPSLRRILHCMSEKPHPETRQSIMISVRSTIRNSKPLNLASNYALGLNPRISGEDEPSETEMTPVTKLVARNATFVESAQKLTIIHRSSGLQNFASRK